MNKNWWFLFEKVKNYQYFATNIFSSEKCEKNWHFRPKNWKGWSHNLETFHEENLGVVKKKPRKRKNYGCSPSLWILIFKIYKYLPIFFQARIWPSHIWTVVFYSAFNSSPKPSATGITKCVGHLWKSSFIGDKEG